MVKIVSHWAASASYVLWSIFILVPQPQGIILGPLLFNLFISDISQNITTKSLLFADDTLLYQPIYSLEDELYLQEDLDVLGQWTSPMG